MGFFSKIFAYFPKPFKYIQRQLDIESQWQQFKVNIKPHRYKIYFFMLIILYPVYNPFLQQNLNRFKTYLTFKMHQSLQPERPPFQMGQNLVKNLIGSILADENIKKQGLNFVQNIINDQNFVDQVLQLLLSSLQNKEFLNNVGTTSKQLIVSQLKDPQIQEELSSFVNRVVSSQKTKEAFIKLIQEAFSSKQSVDTIIELLKKGVSAQQVKESLSETVNFSVKQLLADEQTINQLRIFIFFLLRKFQNDDQIKGMMDILFAKGLGMFKKNKKHPQLDKILKTGKSKTTDSL